ncbi:MAG TPA: hypothetical protein VG267_02490 [Terracidiphilus sp.]|jgi:hypothetical protein|nr:hypothetical protein [Terracidiphilus sp.]
MSLNVLVVPENPTYNGAILKPLCERLFLECGRTQANIEVMANPRTNGYEHAKSLFQHKILDLYSHKHLVLFLPDSDGHDRSAEFAVMEADFEAKTVAAGKSIRLICCAAVPEIEAWLLAGHRDTWEPGWSWEAMRADRSIKENYFYPFLRNRGQDLSGYPDEGRRQLMQAALRNYQGIKQRCPEVQLLETRIRAHLSGHP